MSQTSKWDDSEANVDYTFKRICKCDKLLQIMRWWNMINVPLDFKNWKITLNKITHLILQQLGYKDEFFQQEMPKLGTFNKVFCQFACLNTYHGYGCLYDMSLTWENKHSLHYLYFQEKLKLNQLWRWGKALGNLYVKFSWISPEENQKINWGQRLYWQQQNF